MKKNEEFEEMNTIINPLALEDELELSGAVTSTHKEEKPDLEGSPKRGRGRPKGSLNKLHKSIEISAPVDMGFRLYGVRELAALFGLSTKTITTYFREGVIRGKIVGNRWKASVEAIKEFKESQGL